MQEILIESGLSKNEAIVYLTLSKIGLSSAYKISKSAGLFKANTYEAIKRLLEKGLVSKETVSKKTLYDASDPSFLIDAINKKKESINEIIPSLRQFQKSNVSESEFKSYKGIDAFLNLLYHLLEYNESIHAYGAPKIAYELLKFRIDNYHKKRIGKKIKMYHIYNFEAIDRIKKLKKMPYTPVRTLPALFDSQVSTVVCGKEVLFTIWKPPIKTIQIVDEDMAQAYKNYFKILWEQAKK